MTPTIQRTLGAVVLLAAGLLSLPIAASLFDHEGAENWIVPLQLAGMAVVGAGLALALPALAPAGAETGRRVLTGAWWGLVAAGVGVLVFWLLLNGLRGA